MKKILFLIPFFFLIVMRSITFSNTSESITYGAFGEVRIYRPIINPNAFVIFISSDEGWNLSNLQTAELLVNKGAMVAGIDSKHFLTNIKKEDVKCYYPASDFENLSLTIQKKYHLNQYFKPVLVGFSSGSALAYGLLAQAPANTFKGVIAFDFCPTLKINKALCSGDGLTSHVMEESRSYFLEADKNLKAPFTILQGNNDQVYSISEAKKFISKMPYSELISLPQVGRNFSVDENYKQQFTMSYDKIKNTPNYIEKIKNDDKRHKQLLAENPFVKDDLPLVILPAKKSSNLPLAFVISGDGGWTSFDESFAEKLVENGMPVIGLDAQQYFWKEKTPEQTTDDVSKALKYYMSKWNKSSFILIGYSFGANAVPFINNRLALPLKDQSKGLFCLSPSETGDFEIRLSDMLNFGGKGAYHVLDELQKVKNVKPICFFGEDEASVEEKIFTAKGVKVIVIPGGHHYDNKYDLLVKNILQGLKAN